MSQKEGTTKLFLAKIIVDIVTRDNMERVGRAEPFIESASWGHLLPVEVAFTTSKYIYLELCLEGSEVLHLGVIVNIKGEASNVTKSKLDMPSGFDMVKGVTEGLFMWES